MGCNTPRARAWDFEEGPIVVLMLHESRASCLGVFLSNCSQEEGCPWV